MAINKKNYLGKTPIELGQKDAVHVAIVSVRAGRPLSPGQRCTLNEDRLAVQDDKGPGIVDPWRKKMVGAGDSFWMVMDPESVVSVAHTWDHELDFSPPTAPVHRNKYLERYAKDLGITYEQLMQACKQAADCDYMVFPGEMDEIDASRIIDLYDIFYEWEQETGYEFESSGSYCCPEKEYPDRLFVWQ